MAVTPYTRSNVAYGPDRYLNDQMAATTGITALAGGAKPGTLLTTTMNVVTVCATAADSVSLPAAVAGAEVFVHNATAASMQVFGLGTDTINSVATATGVAQATLKSALYKCVVAGNWIRLLSA